MRQFFSAGTDVFPVIFLDLQQTMNVRPENIAWVISRDVWMGNSECGGDPQTWARTLIKFDNDVDAAALSLEEKGMLVRLDQNILPSRFRFPVIPPDELKLARNITKVVRRGRVTSIRHRRTQDGLCIAVIDFGSGLPSWESCASIDEIIFIHATSPGPFNESDPTIPIFNNPKMMTLNLLVTGPRTFSMSLLAKVEAGRRKKTLDLDFLRRFLNANEGSWTENSILRGAIQPLSPAFPYRPITNLAILLAALDDDPLVALDWMKQNRLCTLSVPGAKITSYADIRMLNAKGKTLGLSEPDLHMLEVLGDKLQAIEETHNRSLC